MAAVEANADTIRTSLVQRGNISNSASNASGVISPAKIIPVKKESIFPNPNPKSSPKPKANVNSHVAKSEDDVIKATGLSEKFIDNLIKMEGFKLKQYNDGNGNKSIGIGHNISADSQYKYGPTITKEQAYNLLKDDLINAKKNLKTLTHGRKFTPNQQEAMTDLVFNLGSKKLENTRFIKLLNEGKFNDAAKEFDFIKISKKVSTHLCKRRMQNVSTFYKEIPSEASINSLKHISQAGLKEYDKEIKEKGFFWGIHTRISKFFFNYNSQKMINNMTEDYNHKISHK